MQGSFDWTVLNIGAQVKDQYGSRKRRHTIRNDKKKPQKLTDSSAPVGCYRITGGSANSMRVLFAAFVLSTLIFAGCEGSESTESILEDDIDASAVPPVADSESFACQRTDVVESYPELAASVSASLPLMSEATLTTPFRCLRLLDAAELSRREEAVNEVDIRRDGADGRLQIPLHEIKTKAFLRHKSLAIVSDGKHFAAIEKECNDIKASGVTDVFAVLPLTSRPTGDDGYSLSHLSRILPQEFIAERAFGVWHIVDLTSKGDLDAPLFRNTEAIREIAHDAKRGGSVVGLERTLIVFDDGRLPGEDDLASLRMRHGQVFVLDDGIKGFLRYRDEATAMARALARPRINERGCNG